MLRDRAYIPVLHSTEKATSRPELVECGRWLATSIRPRDEMLQESRQAIIGQPLNAGGRCVIRLPPDGSRKTVQDINTSITYDSLRPHKSFPRWLNMDVRQDAH